MKKRNVKRAKIATLVLFVLAVTLLLTSVVGGTYAALTYFSENYRADMELYSIGVSLLENDNAVAWRDYTHADDVWNEQSGVLLANMLGEDEVLSYGYDYDEKLSAKNSGTIDEYVRVTVSRYWVDEDGVKQPFLDPETIKLDIEGEGWIENPAEATAERKVLYYSSVVPAGAVTSTFARTLSIDPEVQTAIFESTTVDENGREVTTTEYAYEGMRFIVKAEVDAVQTHNAADAFKSAWGVAATFDANGNVTSVK